jgi:peptidyl-prolyl cis-trans isomerase C
MNAAATTRLDSWLLGSLLIGAIVFSGFGCGKEAPTSPDVNAPAPEAPAPAETPAEPQVDPNAVAATVKGDEITEGQILTRLALEMGQSQTRLASIPAAYVEQMKKQILEALIVEQLLDQQTAAAGITVSDDEARAEMTRQLQAENPDLTLDSYMAIVETRGGDPNAVLANVKMGMRFQKLMEPRWQGQVDVNEAEAQAYYDTNVGQFETPDEVRASHILIQPATGADVDPNVAKAEARGQIEALLTQIREGADFAELASEHSNCPSAAQGGDLDFFKRGDMVPEFDEAAFAMQPGEVSDVVETQFGFHIIKVTDRRDARTTPFDEARETIAEELADQKKSAIAAEYIQSLKDSATIVYPADDQATEPARVRPTEPRGSSEP